MSQIKKIGSVVLSGAMVMSLAACTSNSTQNTESSAQSELKLTAGTYTATTKGMKGDLTVEVTVSESSIDDVKVTSHSETYGIGYGVDNAPIDVIPSQIVENQSLAIDMITGATITSNAILNATKDALGQAGADVDALTAKAVAPKEVETSLDAQIAIAGAGAAGLAAGIEALRAGATNVVIVEKQGISGGATTRSGGKLLAAGTTWQEKQGYSDSAQQLKDYFYTMVGSEQLNETMIDAFVNNSVENLTWLEDMGVMVYDVEAIHQSLTPWRVHNTTNKEDHHGGGMTDGFGGNIAVPMMEEYLKLGGKIVYNCAVTELLTDDNNAVIGMKGTYNNGETLTVNSNNVIIATGGYAQNREMMARYKESVGEKYATSVPAGNIGEGITMASAIGAKVYDAPEAQTVYVDYTAGVGINEEAGLILNGDGKRVANEYTYQYHVGDAIFKSGTDHGWYIATANDPSPMVQYAMTLEKTLQSDSIEGLAELMEVDADALKAEIDHYNELCANKNDTDFGKPSDYLYPIEGDTYYALRLNPSVTVTFGGLVTDENAQVLDTQDQPIKGLYAAGEVAFTGLFGDEYPCCGMAIGSAVYFGRVAGKLAASNI